MPDIQLNRGWLFWASFLGLCALTVFWAIFALLSGAEEAGGGLYGLIRNAPNAAPWIALIAVLVISYLFPVVGGVVFVTAGLLSLGFFETYRHITTFTLITLPYLVLGTFMILADRRSD